MKSKGYFSTAFLLVFLISIFTPQPSVNAADHTYTVVSTLNIGVGTLRWAINQANTHTDPADNVTIDFNLPVIDPNYDGTAEVWTITPTDVLPILTGSNTTIDGYTQDGASLPTEWRSPILKVVVDGSALPINFLSIGLGIASSNNVISGLVIQNFPSNAIALGLPTIEVTNNIISGNCIGTDYECAHDEGNQGDGVFIGYGAKNNIIGGESPEEKNIILFNGLDGVGIYGSGTDGNHVSGNIILSNDYNGVFVYGGAQHNTIGGETEGERNLISANQKDGVRIHGSGTERNIIAGNYIGTASDGNLAIPNVENGVQITLGAQENVIGGSTAGSGNLISGNNLSGVMISGTNTISNTVAGNLIGTYYDGTATISNQYGIQITAGAQYNLVGGDSENERNIISGNLDYGVYIADSGTTYNTIAGNFIGTDLTGTAALGNSNGGVKVIDDAAMNTIGGVAEGQRNLISGNSGYGVWLSGAAVSGNEVIGNFIGTNISGTQVISNTKSGVFIDFGAHDNTVGGDSSSERNLISGNGAFGVEIYWDANHNTVSGNYIGTDVGGTLALGNSRYGVAINRSQDNVIGGDTAGTGNLISGNGESGVEIWHADATGNTLSGNLIGTGKDGRQSLPNSAGIEIKDGASDNVVGPGNIIANNSDDGVVVNHADTINNVITQNSIFSNDHGILLEDGANGGISPPVITSASSSGQVLGTACSGCVVELFWNSTPDGEGESFIGTTTASGSGAFTLAAPLPSIYNLTATATDGRGTSEFSEVYNPGYPIFLPLVMNGE